MICVIDNYDSFVYNLVQYLGELGMKTRVFRNDQITAEALLDLQPDGVLLSPGPCTPGEAGICVDLVRKLGPILPVLGVCLGHQAIAAAFGGEVIRAKSVMHGKTSDIYHDGQGVYQGLPNPFTAARYHSLVVEESTLPDCLEISAWTNDGVIMGIRHRVYPVAGVQYHPESILTDSGMPLIRNFLARCRSKDTALSENLSSGLGSGGSL
ncbi:MAG TPA: aminodeoxychorismate/anthranilate synthase component II [bacterium]|nr:aminodeoxychorismate/anthranilate synthase component II [bacterium]